MRALAVLALALPFGPAGTPPAEPWETISVLGLDLLVGPRKTEIGLGGLTATMPVKGAGGEGVAVVRQGLSRDISVTLREADAKELAALFNLPPWARKVLVGKVGLIELKVVGDQFDLKARGFRVPGDPITKIEATGDLKAKTVTVKAYIFNGLLEYSGRLPLE